MNNYYYRGIYQGFRCYQFSKLKNNTFEFDLIRKYVIDNKILEPKSEFIQFEKQISFYFSLAKKQNKTTIYQLSDIDDLYVKYYIFFVDGTEPIIFNLPIYILKTINEQLNE